MSPTLFGLELPQLTLEQPPAFSSEASCQRWLASLGSTNARQTQALLLRQLNLLNRFEMPSDERFTVLELLRAPIYSVHYECSIRFTARPLPLAPPEQAALDTCQALWQALEIGYLHCLQDFIDSAVAANEETRRRVAMAGTRAMTALQSSYLDHCRAALLPSPGYWQHLHKMYRTMEKLHLSHLPVEDPLRAKFTTSATTLYVENLLLAAANPLELNPAQIAQVSYWARLWSSKVHVMNTPPLDLRTPPLGVDTAGEEAGMFRAHPVASEHVRWLDMAGARIAIKQCLAALEKGESPANLKLGKDAVQPACEILLRQVYQDWCRGGRRSIVRGGSGACQVVVGIEAIHYFFSGQVFGERGFFAMDDDSAGATIDDSEIDSYTIEDWQELAENVTDILLKRPLNQLGKRLARAQLVAVRTSSNDSLQIGKVQWAAVSGNRDTLLAGIHILPGPPEAASLRTEGIGPIKAQYCRGFNLPPIDGLGEPASVLTPPTWFQPGHIIEMRTEYATRRLRLTSRLESGTDFDRCTFEVL
jgi:hypothetical protein